MCGGCGARLSRDRSYDVRSSCPDVNFAGRIDSPLRWSWTVIYSLFFRAKMKSGAHVLVLLFAPAHDALREDTQGADVRLAQKRAPSVLSQFSGFVYRTSSACDRPLSRGHAR